MEYGELLKQTDAILCALKGCNRDSVFNTRLSDAIPEKKAQNDLLTRFYLGLLEKKVSEVEGDLTKIFEFGIFCDFLTYWNATAIGVRHSQQVLCTTGKADAEAQLALLGLVSFLSKENVLTLWNSIAEPPVPACDRCRTNGAKEQVMLRGWKDLYEQVSYFDTCITEDLFKRGLMQLQQSFRKEGKLLLENRQPLFLPLRRSERISITDSNNGSGTDLYFTFGIIYEK